MEKPRSRSTSTSIYWAQTLSSTLCPHILLYFSLPIVLILSLLHTGLSSNRQGGELYAVAASSIQHYPRDKALASK